MAKWLYRMARGAVQRRGAVLAAWLAVLVVVGVLGTALAGETTTTFSIPGIESQRANDLLAAEFPGANGGTIRAVFAAPEGTTLTEPAAQDAIAAALSAAGGVDGVIGVTELTLSPEQTIGFADVIFLDTADAVTETARQAVFASFDEARSTGLQVEFGGSAAQGLGEIAGAGEIIGVAVAFVVLLITLGSLVAAGLPLLTALIGVGVGLLGVQFASRFVDMASASTSLALMLGLAVGIDYALFIVARHREQLADPEVTVADSIARAIGTAGSAVVFAGLTVIIALSALAVVGIPFLTVMGLAAAGTVAVAVLVALTLVPALLGFAGERLRPKAKNVLERHAAPARGSFWLRWGQLIQRAPIAVLIAGIALIGLMAFPATHLRLGLPSNEVQPADSTLHQSYLLLTRGFGEGFNSTLIYVVDAGDVAEEQRAGLADEVADAIRLDPGVALVSAPVFNQSGQIAVLSVVPFTGPDDEATVELVERLRDAPKALVEAGGGAAYLTGITALAIDVSDKLAEALPLFLAVIVLLAMILLAIAFRSLLVPIKAVAGFLFTIAASLGLTVWIFQDGRLLDLLNVGAPAPIVSFIPVILVGVLFGLAMDYEVFLVSRMRERFQHGDDAESSVLHGLEQSGRVVCAAALIMAAVFGGFLLGHDPIIKTMAFALAVGVLIDAFLVRMTLVPAVMLLLGRRVWALPGWVDRLLPNVDIEGASLPQPAPKIAPVPVLVDVVEPNPVP